MKRDIKEMAKEILQEEADALIGLKSFINQDFEDCLNEILASKGRLIVTGIGKSAIIAQKMVATFNSTGTPSIFMHAADAIHGDLGIIQPDDMVLCLSKSGDTPEISILIPYLKQSGNILIAMTGNPSSFLAKEADYFINSSVVKEACPHNLAPTCSSTAQLALGDAMASCLIELRGFTTNDFARYHPGGILGKRLYMKVADIYKHNEKPQVAPTDKMPDVILEISSKRLGVTAVLDESGILIGAITDGDLRRMIQKSVDYTRLTAIEVMNSKPRIVREELLAVEALDIMKKANITNLFIVDKMDIYQGVIHMHDILREGIY